MMFPVQLKNNAYSKLFEPVTEMFALPQYRELDLTPFLAPFFMLFFGMCMGDGGYGLIIWLTCFIIGRKASPSVKGLSCAGAIFGNYDSDRRFADRFFFWYRVGFRGMALAGWREVTLPDGGELREVSGRI